MVTLCVCVCVCVSLKASAVKHLASLLAKEDCQLLSLCVEDSHLKELTPVLLEAVVEGHNLVTLNLRYPCSCHSLPCPNVCSLLPLVGTRWG